MPLTRKLFSIGKGPKEDGILINSKLLYYTNKHDTCKQQQDFSLKCNYCQYQMQFTDHTISFQE